MANPTTIVATQLSDYLGMPDNYWPIPSTAKTYYPGEMIGKYTDGKAYSFDDTQGLLFTGINATTPQFIVSSTVPAQALFLRTRQPRLYTMPLGSGSASRLTDIGKPVYSLFSGTVTMDPTATTYSNLAGFIADVVVTDPTTLTGTSVVISPPPAWLGRSGNAGWLVAPATGGKTYDASVINKTVAVPNTAAETFVLPAVAATTPGDRIRFIKTTSDSFAFTLDGNASETITGSTTYVSATSQYTVVEVISTGDAWVVNLPSLATGTTTFTGNVSTSSATLTVASTSASALTVGANGATNPVLKVNASTASVATGISVTGAAAAGGVAVAVISSGTDESLTLDAKGAGTVTINGTATGGITLGTTVTLSKSLTGSIGASTAAAGTTTADAGALPAGTATFYPTTAADDTKGVVINAADKVTGRALFIGNGVGNKILKVYPPSGGNINALGADAAFSSVSGKGVFIVCLSGSGNTWLAM